MPNQFTKPWTNNEIEFLRSNIGKMTYKNMGEFINRSYSSIQSKIRYLPFQKKVKKHLVNSNFFKSWSPEMSYVLGFIAADGNICHSGRAHTLHIACDDRDVIEKIKKVLDYSGPIYEKNRFNSKISYSLRICDQIIFNDLQKVGISERKSLTLLPKVHKAFTTDFLRGFFDGDGTVYLHNTKYPSKLRVIFYTASKPMAKFIHSNLKNILKNTHSSNIQSKITKYKNPYYAISLGHKASCELYSKIYKNNDLYMNRKYKKFIQGMK